MQVRCLPATSATPLGDWSGDTLVLGLFAGEDGQPLLGVLEALLGAGVRKRLEQRAFKAKPAEVLAFERMDVEPAAVVVVGLGEADGFSLDGLRSAVAKAAATAAASGGHHLGLAFPLASLPAEITPATAAAAMAEAVRLSLYTDQRFRSEAEPKPRPDAVTLIGLDDSADAALSRVGAVCAGVELARELVAAPPNVVTPQALADTASAIAEAYGAELKVLERSDCQALGMGAYLGVAQGSDLPPKFIHLTIRPEGAIQRRVALVGKGLTFDSGGYNLKTGGSQIEMMKYDMGGSAAVLGAARALAELRPAGVEVHVIVAACENMISGGAVHPGDIVTASNGKTIEINNTDAEGRLTLADALIYACKLEPDAVVDLATLTGACVIALGEEIAGLWSTSDALAAALLQAGQVGGEAFWRMPLRASYRSGLKSPVADMKNTGPRPGGSITAALFLQDFVTKDLPWAHLDIAGTVWSDKGRGMDPAGATGFGVRTLVQWVQAGATA
ncbi:leucyl aminopeptidase [Synechococcus sp. CS-1328]|uniref:leucyl aminopeptidase n=1 Tax=Synechococcus sp. CS-1328 TaxID=2847976 RepID=UPI00223B8DDE|nr:leucyl aminopeptidase [Synechococcus sp. CS-1328]MCT0225868.1 leucyl aminopeptidase [Synechococcus sp. CS-1328]